MYFPFFTNKNASFMRKGSACPLSCFPSHIFPAPQKRALLRSCYPLFRHLQSVPCERRKGRRRKGRRRGLDCKEMSTCDLVTEPDRPDVKRLLLFSSHGVTGDESHHSAFHNLSKYVSLTFQTGSPASSDLPALSMTAVVSKNSQSTKPRGKL